MDTPNTPPYTQGSQNQRDETLWGIARKRAEFKKNLLSYLIVNAMLWLIWAFTNLDDMNFRHIPWPAYVTFFWGIGMAFNFFGAYVMPGYSLEEKEYQNLVNKKKGL